MQDILFYKKIDDCYNLSKKHFCFKAVGFFDEIQLSDAINYCNNKYKRDYLTYGGFLQANRKMIGFSNHNESVTDNSKLFPIKCIKYQHLSGYKSSLIKHGDVLGSLMAQNIAREKIGDIVFKGNEIFVFCTQTIADVCLSLNKISSSNVTASLFEEADSVSFNCTEFFEGQTTIASNRIDNIVARLCGFSRTSAEELIIQKNVLINSMVIQKPSKNVSNGDVITIRKHGKFIVVSCDTYSKKSKIIFNYKKYK